MQTGVQSNPFPAQEFRFSVLKNIKLLCIAVGGLATGAWLTTLPEWKTSTSGWALLVLMTPALLVSVKRLIDRRPVLRLTAEGVYYRQRTERFIPWSSIRSTRVLIVGKIEFVCLQMSTADMQRLLNIPSGHVAGVEPGEFPIGLAELSLTSHQLTQLIDSNIGPI
jgi:hypothetical protein